MNAHKVYEINGCEFYEHHYYNLEENLWIEYIGDNKFKVGLMPTTQATLGKISSINMKGAGTVLDKGKPMAMLEARRFLGHVHAPFKSVIMERNDKLREKPYLLQEDPYGEGWLYVLESADTEDAFKSISSWGSVKERLELEVARRGIICFKTVPDYVYAAIGIDCSQVIMVLSDKVAEMPLGSVLHVIADYNLGAEEDLERWSKVTGNEVLEFRIERGKKIAHALIRRTR